ncbi:MAG: Hsp20/alpha crystallin family protein [Winogradskyella sp.]|nr:Hsp20/alpha crystallin family protein [Winogradskyella sp.]MBT8377285.1 Hsp20/alpha crystallin family protein [Bacteroidia bacterium]NNK40882.1 Hsp20/alpha crystallin family protein [Winogradskyella sp.]NNL82195.1 Hsp20/alpha crystallin family protein [Winogradskyella sp.]
MSLIKFNNRNRLFPWNNENLKSILSTEDFFNTDFFEEDGLMPAMNVKEREEDYEVEFAAPGFTKKDFEITLEDNMLKVCGEKERKSQEKEEDYTRREFSYSSFKRSLQLPNTIDANKDIKASYKDGILKLNLLKKPEAKTLPKKVIEVK